MGAFCSRTVPEEDHSDGLSLNGQLHPPATQYQWTSPILPHNGNNSPVFATLGSRPASTRKSEEPYEIRSPARKKLIAGSDTEEEFNREALGGEGEEKKQLSRVLSNKARNAKSRTTTAAKKGASKVSEVSSLLGRASHAGFGKAVEALDTFGSSITNLGGGFGGGLAPKGNKIDILAFEVANTIVKGFNLKQSLSEENIRILKEDVLQSEGVQRLVSKDMAVLWAIAASDKRNELKVFAAEVVRFGNHCRDPQWHQLDRIFNKLGTEVPIPRQEKQEAEEEMQELMMLAQYTAELYHELHALDRFQIDVKRKLDEEEMGTGSQKGDGLAILRNDLKTQQKHVKLLKKQSLWSKVLEEVMEKLMDIVYYLHQQIDDTFGPLGENVLNEKEAKAENTQRLGALGLALHYANIINQIDSLVSRPTSVPPNTRDNLYQGLPPSIKASLRNSLQMGPDKDEIPSSHLSISEIKEEMEKILDWLVPIATNTTKAHHGFGWVGEWATLGAVVDRRLGAQNGLTLLQTLHHADQTTAENYISQLIVWLNLLISRARSNMTGNRSPYKSPFRSPVKKTSTMSSPPGAQQTSGQQGGIGPELSNEERQMLKDSLAKTRKITPGISKSQEFGRRKLSDQSTNRLYKSYSHSPSTNSKSESPVVPKNRQALELGLDIERIKVLDKIDRVDTLHGG
ncbi:hypothetical protein O6H91_19G043500 [Diphasiastrum complanatum]|uniref:Uncharacterized protein n=5 Tax=Diphasiastrum complanatum TaxID=34168 RepID=A0ACC2AUN2_DIPCM|nr:hypothetical protein O6H91_19G043500 [Diphasiastrum complanatum]KAJ7521236.1 hypothetical protein O6H91_19G043500 [Diphasiastrum complanatum]KAJ7521238.1 hypothetical protein O6H91_19G043500 [Diphasiastrum complanatum]KAJ7521240.1 hypothetical protein O6H91_19G043500 [Diphasiastrum complanatum]KAJ7521241.1 hypothetical protein O6H91_19G043500 [Diphasiastrum complanatum]